MLKRLYYFAIEDLGRCTVASCGCAADYINSDRSVRICGHHYLEVMSDGC